MCFFHVGHISIEVDIIEKEALDRRLRRLKKAKKTGCLEVIDKGQIHFEEKNQDIEIKVENKVDALVATRMNKGPKGVQPKMCNSWYIDMYGERHVQEMIFPDDYLLQQLRGKPKGIQQILEEQNL
ncbi:14372_t:CDS:2 [Cetraspora pellucida]|uniref:14372_t:CDS:1 n=1 Tax=Cetraspora pellucida TaxID=1433469 RepID=A0A9N9DVY6_9GLOM|nr:14372_t:CDS:2 [Cetraspora pellucida]